MEATDYEYYFHVLVLSKAELKRQIKANYYRPLSDFQTPAVGTAKIRAGIDSMDYEWEMENYA